MPSRPDYVACWLGISRVGGVVALINTRLVGQSLAHCINVTRADHVILAAEYREVFAAARPRLDRAPTIWRSGAAENGADLEKAISRCSMSWAKWGPSAGFRL
jgi:fatty-acyl-CoA synthase